MSRFIPFLKPRIAPHLTVAYSKSTEELFFFSFGARKILYAGHVFHTIVPYLDGKHMISEIARKTHLSVPRIAAFVFHLQENGVFDGMKNPGIFLPEARPVFPAKTRVSASILFAERSAVTVEAYKLLRKRGYKNLSFPTSPLPGIIRKELTGKLLVIGSFQNDRLNALVNAVCMQSPTRWLPYRIDMSNSRADIGPFVHAGAIGCHSCYSRKIKENHLFKKRDLIFIGEKRITRRLK